MAVLLEADEAMAHFLEGRNRSVTPGDDAMLEVAPEAEHEIIRAAYVVLAKRYHPDTATAASPHNDEKFHLITEAYEILRDPDLRAQYDSDHARQKLAQLEKFEDAHRRTREQAQRKQRERAVRNLLVVVFAVGGFALGALAVGLVKALAPNSFPANIDLAMDTEKFERSSNFLSDKAAPNQDPTESLQALRQAEGLAATYQELLEQERAPNRGLEEQLAAYRDEQELLAKERARNQGLEQQLAAHRDDQELLAQERARAQELERQLAAQQDDQKLLAQERARNEGLKQQLAARRDDQKLLAQERARTQELERQLAAPQDDQKLLAQERARNEGLKQQLAARRDDQKLLAQERARNQELQRELAARWDDQAFLAQERART